MGIITIDSKVLTKPNSSIEHVNKYLMSLVKKNNSAKLSELWDTADDKWKPLVAKHWGMINEGRNLFMVKVGAGKAEIKVVEPDIVRVGDDFDEPEESNDPDAILEQEKADEEEEEEVKELSPQKTKARGRKKVFAST